MLSLQSDASWLLGAAALLALNTFLGSSLIGCLAFFVWFALGVRRFAARITPVDALESYLFGVLCMGSLLTAGALALYFTGPLNPFTVAGVVLLLTAIVLYLPPQALPRVTWRLPVFSSVLWHIPAVIFLCQLVVLVFLLIGRTAEPLVSPWLLFPAIIFALFFASMLLIALQSGSTRWMLLFACTQTFLALGVSAFVYVVGFGFDPFIHRAAETALVTVGRIEPLSILYSGQYALVGFLYFLTGLSIRTIDVWLLPMSASALLPIVAYVGLRFGWGVREESARLGWLAVLFIPFMLLTFTVPFTIVYALFMGALFLFPMAKSNSWWMALTVTSFLGIFLHPLLGVPTFLLIVFAGAYERISDILRKGLVVICFALTLILAVPTMLFVYQYQAGSAVHLVGLWQNVSSFLSLFANPFNNYHPSILWWYHALYEFRYWQPVLLMLLAFPLVFVWGREKRRHAVVLFAFAGGLLGCIYAVSTLFVFKGIIAHEQHEFALRLLQSLYVVPIPLIAILLDRIDHVRPLRWAMVIALSFFATTSWYFSYPQFNAKFAYYSPSVSVYDVQAVRAIKEDAGERSHIVLSNQMTSAAALQEFGFAQYHYLNGEEVLWYAIPTGGPLYEYYLRAINAGGERVFPELIEVAGVDSVYLVMHSYWFWNPDVIKQIEVQSSQQIRIADKLIIYRFD